MKTQIQENENKQNFVDVLQALKKKGRSKVSRKLDKVSFEQKAGSLLLKSTNFVEIGRIIFAQSCFYSGLERRVLLTVLGLIYMDLTPQISYKYMDVYISEKTTIV